MTRARPIPLSFTRQQTAARRIVLVSVKQLLTPTQGNARKSHQEMLQVSKATDLQWALVLFQMGSLRQTEKDRGKRKHKLATRQSTDDDKPWAIPCLQRLSWTEPWCPERGRLPKERCTSGSLAPQVRDRQSAFKKKGGRNCSLGSHF